MEVTTQEAGTVMVDKIDTTIYQKSCEEKKRLKALKKQYKASLK